MSNLSGMSTRFVLPQWVVEKYRSKPEPFGYNGFGQLIYMRTYSRIKADGNNECWAETVERIVNGTYTMQRRHVEKHGLGWDETKALDSATEMYDRIFHLKFTPPGRGLWAMGTSITEQKGIFAALNNCGFVSTEHIATEKSKPFRFLMDMSMLGVGVGFDVKGVGKVVIKDMKKFEEIVLPPGAVLTYPRNLQREEAVALLIETIEKHRDELSNELVKLKEGDYKISAYKSDIEMYNNECDYIRNLDMRAIVVHSVDDTREGWVNSTGALIDSYLDGGYPIVFDYSKIREAGHVLKTFGGLSSGPIPLIDLHMMIRRVMTKNIGQPITVRTIVDIMNLIGKCVVAGNVRRCLAEGTLVHCTRGLVPIEKVVVGDSVQTAWGVQQVTNVFDQGDAQVFKVSTTNGSFTATANHRMAESCDESGTMKWIHVGNMKVGTTIVIAAQNTQNTQNTQNAQNIQLATVTSIESAGIQHVWDIEVKKTGYFAIGEGLISHNSSEIALGSGSDTDFINLKNYELYPDRMSYGWCSNNSVYGHIGMDYDEIARRVVDNGEPGIFWMKTAQDYSRLCDAPDYKDSKVVGTNPCGEQSLENYELCCLCEVFLNTHTSLEDFQRTLKFAYLYAKTVTLGDTHWVETNRVLLRNRRIGCSLTGIAQFLANRSIEDLRVWCDSGYKTIQRYDQVYSDYLAIPRSIKTTSIKPSGCVVPSTRVIVTDDPDGECKPVALTMLELFEDGGVNLTDCCVKEVSNKWFVPKREMWVVSDGRRDKITGLYCNGTAECVQIPLEGGGSITCTRDHKFVVSRMIDNEMQKVWVRAEDLLETDELLMDLPKE